MEVRAFFLGMRIFYGAFLSSIIFVVAIAATYVDVLDLTIEEPFDKLLLILPIVIGICTLFIARFIFRLKTKKNSSLHTLEEKLNAYRQAFIIRSALIEGMALLSAVCYALSKDPILLFLAGFFWAIIVFYRPSRKEVQKVFELSPTESFTLENDKAVIFRDVDQT